MSSTRVTRRAGVFFCIVSSLLVFAVALTGCRSGAPNEKLSRFEFNEPHMGTLFSITVYAPDADAATAAAEAAFRRVAKLDRMMTDYDPKSELMQLCRRPVGEPTQVSPELFEIIRESVRVARETDGAFDITVGPFVRAWRAARKSKVLPTAEVRSRRCVQIHRLAKAASRRAQPDRYVAGAAHATGPRRHRQGLCG